VFVFSEDVLLNFFSKTSKHKSFGFITKLDPNEVTHSKFESIGYSNDYDYSNGHFTLNNPPPVR